ncbi:hypothetical protein LCGC14_2208560 [marine sediment metagenome]|uniref:Uncharacterized protein n=1 Tax=marine sediment metagenome TaxID=412755 RepID=A0A0F9DEE2_9ZZZZ
MQSIQRRIDKKYELVTAPFAYDETQFNELGTADAAVNFYKPKVGKQFVITGIIAAGNLSIAANALATVVVYEGSSTTDTSADKTLIQFGITRLQTEPLLSLNILVNEGKFINAKTDDDDVFLTIMGYYIPALGGAQ